MYSLTSLVIVTSLIVLSVAYNDLPSFFPRCHRLDPNLSDCWLRASNETRQYLIKGIPELRLPPMDPFNFPKVSLEQGTEAINAKAELTNIVTRGMGSYVFTYFNFDLEKMQMHIKGNFGKLDLDGNYKISGKMLIAPIEGSGKFSAGIDESSIEIFKNFKIVQKNGEGYLSPTSSNVTMNVSKPRVHFDGLFGGDKEIGDLTNQVIHDNIDELFNELKPVLEKVIGSVVDDLLFKGIEENIPFDKLYPNIP